MNAIKSHQNKITHRVSPNIVNKSITSGLLTIAKKNAKTMIKDNSAHVNPALPSANQSFSNQLVLT